MAPRQATGDSSSGTSADGSPHGTLAPIRDRRRGHPVEPKPAGNAGGRADPEQREVRRIREDDVPWREGPEERDAAGGHVAQEVRRDTERDRETGRSAARSGAEADADRDGDGEQ